MAFRPVTSLANIDQRWLNYSYARTGVGLPNCFTYATARISQTVGYNQSLDGAHRVVGAGQLWETHASEFINSAVAQPGALAIFKGRIYGHVACVEVVGNRMMITESNLGDYGSGYFRCVEMDKRVGSTHPCDGAMVLVGFLIHKDLIPKPEPVKPRKIGYQTHIENKGWTHISYDGETSGTEGQSLRCEAIKVFSVDGTVFEEVQAHLQDFGWRTYKYPGANTVIGTTGQSRRLEALKIKTSKKCKMRAHIQDVGWTKWTDCDGKAMVGTEGQSKRLEAIQIKRV